MKVRAVVLGVVAALALTAAPAFADPDVKAKVKLNPSGVSVKVK